MPKACPKESKQRAIDLVLVDGIGIVGAVNLEPHNPQHVSP